MKKIEINILFFIIALSLIITACEKDKNFIADNTINTGVGYVPVSTNTLQDVSVIPVRTLATSSGTATAFTGGTTFKTELTFFSQSPIKEINLYNTIGTSARTLVTTIPYAPAFSQSKRLDTLIVPYTVPASAAIGTVIKLEYEILNTNALSVIRTVFVKRS